MLRAGTPGRGYQPPPQSRRWQAPHMLNMSEEPAHNDGAGPNGGRSGNDFQSFPTNTSGQAVQEKTTDDSHIPLHLLRTTGNGSVKIYLPSGQKYTNYQAICNNPVIQQRPR